MNPGVSLTSTGVLFHRFINANADEATSGSPPSQGTTSTRAITGAGLKKCRPITRSEASHADAIDVTESDDVFVANTASRDTAPSSRRNSDRLTSRSSTTASTTRPQLRYGDRSLPSGSHV